MGGRSDRDLGEESVSEPMAVAGGGGRFRRLQGRRRGVKSAAWHCSFGPGNERVLCPPCAPII